MNLWIWLSHRFGPEAFPGLEEVSGKSESVISLMDQGLDQMCNINKRARKVRAKVRTKKPIPARMNTKTALLLKHDPVAMEYLADSSNHKFINSYEWTSPAVSRATASLSPHAYMEPVKLAA